MKLIHTTNPEAARGILSEGFRDSDEERDQGRLYRGSWFSDVQLKEIGSVFLTISLPDVIAQQYELRGDLHGYRRWLIPANVLASYGPAQKVD